MGAEDRTLSGTGLCRQNGPIAAISLGGPWSVPSTASTYWLTTAHSGISSVIACSPWSGRSSALNTAIPGPESVERRRVCTPVFDEVMDRSAELYRPFEPRLPRTGLLCSELRLQGALRHEHQRSGCNASNRACAPPPRATRCTGRSGRRCGGSSAMRPAMSAVAEMMRFVDLSEEPPLGRLDAELRAEERRQDSRAGVSQRRSFDEIQD